MASKKRKKKASKASQPRTRTPRTGPNKSAFIREHPTLSAAELVAKGGEEGITFTPAFVHAVRSNAKAAAKQASGEAPTKGPGRRKREGTASAFIRDQLAAGKTPSEIIAAGAASGMKFSVNLIYSVRGRASNNAAPISSVRAKPGRKPRSAAPATSSGDMSQFKRMALQLGLDRARQALDDLERALTSLIG